MFVLNRRKVLIAVFYTLIFNTFIAIFLTSIEFGGGFVINFIFSQCMGISICSCILAVHRIFKPKTPIFQFFVIMASMTIGAVIGTVLGSMAVGFDPSIFLRKYVLFIRFVFLGILFGSVITYFFFSREKISATETLVQEERIKRLTSEKKALEANLKLLQAQTEPHFLFNTLSNILSLMDTDLEKGKSMQMDLIQYLRTSLLRTRGDVITVAQEIEMIQAYLNIFKIRMGDRLRYTIDIPDAVMDLPFPPMLLQPLVENAIKHGLEPKIEGGEVSIRGEENGNTLRLEVSDTGLGFHRDDAQGVGLSNIRERLQSLYGDRGRLVLEENRPSGLKAIIEVPHGRDQSNHS